MKPASPLQNTVRVIATTPCRGFPAFRLERGSEGAEGIFQGGWHRMEMKNAQNIYEIRQRRDKRGVDLISDAQPFKPMGSAARSFVAAHIAP